MGSGGINYSEWCARFGDLGAQYEEFRSLLRQLFRAGRMRDFVEACRRHGYGGNVGLEDMPSLKRRQLLAELRELARD